MFSSILLLCLIFLIFLTQMLSASCFSRFPVNTRDADKFGTDKEEMISVQEFNAIEDLRARIDGLERYTDKFILRYLFSCDMQQKKAISKIEEYLQAKRRWGLENGIVPVYSARRGTPGDRWCLEPSCFMIPQCHDKEGNRIIWSMEHKKDPDYDFDIPEHTEHFWQSVFVHTEVMPFLLTVREMRRSAIEIANWNWWEKSSKSKEQLSKDTRRNMTVRNMTPLCVTKAYIVCDSFWGRLKQRWKLRKAAKYLPQAFTAKVFVVAPSAIRKRVPKESLLDIYGGAVKFNWDYTPIIASAIASEEKLLSLWKTVRRKLALADPIPAKARDSTVSMKIHGLLQDLRAAT